MLAEILNVVSIQIENKLYKMKVSASLNQPMISQVTY